MIGSLLSMVGGAGGAVKAVGGVVKSVFGDKAAKEKYAADEASAGLAQFAAEFQVNNRTWFDSFIDGINRLMRPTMWYSTLAYLWLSWGDIEMFVDVTNGLRLVPEPVFVLLGIMVGFLFPIREIKGAWTKSISNFKKNGGELIKQIKAENKSIDQWKKQRGSHRQSK
jgi:hypothetical protein